MKPQSIIIKIDEETKLALFNNHDGTWNKEELILAGDAGDEWIVTKTTIISAHYVMEVIRQQF